MTPREQRNLLLAEKLIRHMRMRHIDACYCSTREEAVLRILSMMPEGSSVSWGGSMTIRDMGLTDAIHEGQYVVYDRDLAETPEDAASVYQQAFTADFYLTSANAVTEDGLIVNIDGRGNRVAAITYGPRRVIFVIGMNKVVAGIDQAISRARHTAAPLNTARLHTDTPCTLNGACHNCLSEHCICNYVHVLRNSFPQGRHIVVLVGEDLGY